MLFTPVHSTDCRARGRGSSGLPGAVLPVRPFKTARQPPVLRRNSTIARWILHPSGTRRPADSRDGEILGPLSILLYTDGGQRPRVEHYQGETGWMNAYTMEYVLMKCR